MHPVWTSGCLDQRCQGIHTVGICELFGQRCRGMHYAIHTAWIRELLFFSSRSTNISKRVTKVANAHAKEQTTEQTRVRKPSAKQNATQKNKTSKTQRKANHKKTKQEKRNAKQTTTSKTQRKANHKRRKAACKDFGPKQSRKQKQKSKTRSKKAKAGCKQRCKQLKRGNLDIMCDTGNRRFSNLAASCFVQSVPFPA